MCPLRVAIRQDMFGFVTSGREKENQITTMDSVFTSLILTHSQSGGTVFVCQTFNVKVFVWTASLKLVPLLASWSCGSMLRPACI